MFYLWIINVCSVGSLDDQRITNFRECGRTLSWRDWRWHSWHLSGGTEGKKTARSGLKFESGTCGIRSVNADCWRATYVVCDVISSDQVWDFWWDRRRWLWVVRSVRARICAQCASGCWNVPLPIWAERTRKCNSPKVISNIHICSPHVSKD
jgi:hypothetical protein